MKSISQVDDQGQDTKQDGSIAQAAKEASELDVILIALGKEPYVEKPGNIRSPYLPEGWYNLR